MNLYPNLKYTLIRVLVYVAVQVHLVYVVES